MNNVARVFDQHNTSRVRRGQLEDVQQDDGSSSAWATLGNDSMPPLMFQLRFADGRIASYAYSDLREIQCRDAGRIELFLLSMCKLVIIIEGRHLKDLAKWLSSAGIRWVQESDPREADRPETDPEIVKITVAQLPD